MKPWFLIGLTGSLLYGISAILFKLLVEERYLAGRPGWALAGIGSGIALCGLTAILFWPVASVGETSWKALAFALPAGLINGFATLLILVAMRSPQTNLSQLVPLYNTNTLIAFVLAVLLFRELPQSGDLIRNLAGALLIVAGTVLIGLR